MQRMTMTFVVPCHALYAPKHVAASPCEPLNMYTLLGVSSIHTAYEKSQKVVAVMVPKQ